MHFSAWYLACFCFFALPQFTYSKTNNWTAPLPPFHTIENTGLFNMANASYNFNIAKEVLNENDKNRLMCLFLNCQPNAVRRCLCLCLPLTT